MLPRLRTYVTDENVLVPCMRLGKRQVRLTRSLPHVRYWTERIANLTLPEVPDFYR